MNIYELNLSMRSPKKNIKIDFVKEKDIIIDIAKEYNAKNKEQNEIVIPSLEIDKESIKFEFISKQVTNRPLKKLSYFSRHLMPFLNKYSSIENKLFKLNYFKDITYINQSENDILNLEKVEIIKKILAIQDLNLIQSLKEKLEALES